METTSQNPVIIKSQFTYENEQNVVPNQSEQNMVPSLSEQNMVPSISEQNVVPIQSEENVVPSQSEQNMVPSISEQNVVPIQSEENVVPSQSEQNMVPIRSGQNVVSNQSEQNAVQSGQNVVRNQSGQNVVRNQSGQNVVPNQSGQNVVPNQNGQNVVPNPSGQNVAPNQSGQKVVPNQSGQNVVPNQNGQKVVPNQSGQNVAPNQSGQKVVPNQSGQNAVRNQNGQNMVPNQVKEKYLVYLCDKGGYCGGWGDRQRGMVSLFLLSLVWKRTFKIIMDFPCDIKRLYKPTKEYNWIFSEKELKGLETKTKTTLDFISNCQPLMKLNMNDSKMAEVLYIKSNCYFYHNIATNFAKFLPSYLQKKTKRAEIFRETWNSFMKPTSRLVHQVLNIRSKGEINKRADNSGKGLVCVHLRTGSGEVLPAGYFGMPLNAAVKVWDFIDDNFHKKSRIFVATDDLDVRKSAISKYGTRYIGSYASILHPDKDRSNITLACSSQESAHVDQLMLSTCEVLIFYKRSGFSLHASYLKTKWRDMYGITDYTNASVTVKKTRY